MRSTNHARVLTEETEEIQDWQDQEPIPVHSVSSELPSPLDEPSPAPPPQSLVAVEDAAMPQCFRISGTPHIDGAYRLEGTFDGMPAYHRPHRSGDLWLVCIDSDWYVTDEKRDSQVEYNPHVLAKGEGGASPAEAKNWIYTSGCERHPFTIQACGEYEIELDNRSEDSDIVISQDFTTTGLRDGLVRDWNATATPDKQAVDGEDDAGASKRGHDEIAEGEGENEEGDRDAKKTKSKAEEAVDDAETSKRSLDAAVEGRSNRSSSSGCRNEGDGEEEREVQRSGAGEASNLVEQAAADWGTYAARGGILNVEDSQADDEETWRRFTGEVDPTKCMARVWNNGKGGQCQRSMKHVSGAIYCPMHAKHRGHGNVDGPIPAEKLKEFLRMEEKAE